MDRRLFVTGLLGVVGTTGIASVLTGRAEALAAVPPVDLAPQSDVLPELPKLPESGGPLGEVDGEWELDEDWDPEAGEELYEGFELAHMRRRRRRRWRRICRRYWHNGYWRRRCRRRPFWIWIWI